MDNAENTMLGWIYREVDLSAIAFPEWEIPVKPSESYDWLLERIQAQYSSDDEDPSTFSNAAWRLTVPPQNRDLQLEPSKISLTLNPGIFDQTAATTRPKIIPFDSPRIDWPIVSGEHFTIELTSFVNTGLLSLLFIGHFVLPKPILRRWRQSA